MKKLLLFTMVLWISGCSWFEDSNEMGKNADQLVSEGSSAFVSEDYKDAVKAYTDLKDWYPFSKYAILAELKIADSHYHLEEYDEAIFAYEEFEKMHPRNEAIPYVIYQTGLCWFEQLGTIDRDYAPAKNGIAQFNRLIDLFPESEYVEKAREHIKVCVDHLSSYELYVADFYFKTKKYAAALQRYEDLIKYYPNSAQSDIAVTKIPECLARLEKLENKD